MELLVQLWCPFEESVMDRALYIFGCARSECQHKAGRYILSTIIIISLIHPICLHPVLSIRAFRGLRYNASYAAKLEKKRARQQEKEASRAKALLEEEKRKQAAKVNPFSVRVVPLLNQEKKHGMHHPYNDATFPFLLLSFLII